MVNIPKATIVLSNRCNLNCSYCFVGKEPGPSLTKSQIRAFIKWFIAQPVEGHYKKLSFLGGEPFLEFDLLKDAILFFKKYNTGRESVIDTIPTNGTILTQEMLDFFKTEKLRVSFSLDGNRISNAARTFKNGEECFDQIVNHLIWFADFMGEPPLIKMTVLPANVSKLYSNAKFLIENGFYKIWPNPGILKVKWTKKNAEIFTREYKKVLKLYLKYRLSRNPVSLVPVDEILKNPARGVDIFCCGLGQEPILCSDGNVYTCTSALSGIDRITKRFKVGRVTQNRVNMDLNTMSRFLKYSLFEEYHLKNKDHPLAHAFKKRLCFGLDEQGKPLKSKHVENILELHIQIYELSVKLFHRYNYFLKKSF